MGQPQPLFHLFSSFQTNITILTTNKCEKCSSSIWRWNSNSQPSDYESPPITTRPGLLPNVSLFRDERVNLLPPTLYHHHHLINICRTCPHAGNFSIKIYFHLKIFLGRPFEKIIINIFVVKCCRLLF